MSEPAIRVANLHKQYTLVQGHARQENLREFLARGVRRLWQRGQASASGKQTFWALQGVSLEVRQGEVVGLIGRNGAGKSTLLKILSRITEPTAGFVEIRGRVGSLLEVGTGFHSELTGRENIYLNGAILGMKKQEIDRKRDAIVAFAEVERFLDMPVKHYSSGMYMRLAFAVAAHLHPEILLVDEVLAVGDAEFQKKCLGKMGDVAREGRTVIFVSHNMAAITQLCERVIWIHDGRIRLDGPAADVVSAYLSVSTAAQSTWRNPSNNSDDDDVRIESVRVLSQDDRPITVTQYYQPFKCEIVYRVNRPQRDLSILCVVYNASGNRLWISWDSDQSGWENGGVKGAGRYLSVCKIPPRLLKPGLYSVSVVARLARKNSPGETWRDLVEHDHVVAFQVSDVDLNLPDRSGLLMPMLEWDVERISDEDLARGNI